MQFVRIDNDPEIVINIKAYYGSIHVKQSLRCFCCSPAEYAADRSATATPPPPHHLSTLPTNLRNSYSLACPSNAILTQPTKHILEARRRRSIYAGASTTGVLVLLDHKVESICSPQPRRNRVTFSQRALISRPAVLEY